MMESFLHMMFSQLQEFWFLLDQHSLVLSQQHELVARMDPALRAKIKMYTNWLPLSPNISSIGRLLLGQVGRTMSQQTKKGCI